MGIYGHKQKGAKMAEAEAGVGIGWREEDWKRYRRLTYLSLLSAVSLRA